ncbi:periplasmic heavy metal sensor [Kordiimonas sp. SCSIO 12610]|uniref:periplasmic heavy metal sensor n=1 Tax=Kordiimonas sp. SCSIO 12610 TaxID=2829597 RepID=UPI0021090D49|nr:periplasmic heavy metal sensor [Kordiimonas sp. SCSIO 12610]UTW55506.1 periplasmic heavy metal sensor [Kordiimonas sp. SCSIO 12610]
MELKSKWIYAVLVVSVAFNIFVLGVWIGKGKKDYKHPPPSGRLEFNLREIARYLPPDARGEVREFMREKRPILRDTLLARREAEQEIRNLLAAETVDKEALRAALDAHASHSLRLQAPVREVLLGTVVELDHETRKKIADNIFRRRGEGRPRERLRRERDTERPRIR